MLRTLALASVIASIGVSPAAAQIVLDGNLDDLTPGSHPDCLEPAGSWQWPSPVYGCETASGQFTIVPTASFDDGATGNSLSHHVNLEAGQQNANIHLPNFFTTTIHEGEHPKVIVTFDIWVADEPGVGGGNIYLGGNHGGGGAGFTDRGPHFGWNRDGTIRAAGPDPFNECPIIVRDSYPVAVWQTVRLEIDLAADTFDFWWAERGDPLVALGDDLVFIFANELDHLDRFTFAHFAGCPDCVT
ncbi:MAG: hypothetical protein ACYTJ0_19470 [Planctomycetota bacterium]|jgi:hypothetical protein